MTVMYLMNTKSKDATNAIKYTSWMELDTKNPTRQKTLFGFVTDVDNYTAS